LDFNRVGEKIHNAKIIDSSKGKNKHKVGRFRVIKKNDHKGYITWFSKYFDDTLHIVISNYDYSNNKLSEHNFLLESNFGGIAETTIDSMGCLYYLGSSDLGSTNGSWKLRIYTPDSDIPINIPLNIPSAREIVPS